MCRRLVCLSGNAFNQIAVRPVYGHRSLHCFFHPGAVSHLSDRKSRKDGPTRLRQIGVNPQTGGYPAQAAVSGPQLRARVE